MSLCKYVKLEKEDHHEPHTFSFLMEIQLQKLPLLHHNPNHTSTIHIKKNKIGHFVN
jgi:hypothetical protein